MSVAVLLEALGWVSVLWLVTVHLLIQRGRLPQAGRAYRMAGCAAAACVVAASAAEEIWPVAVLGMLWLRIEVFGHRHQPEPSADPEWSELHDLSRTSFPVDPGGSAGSAGSGKRSGRPHDRAPEPERMPTLLIGALARTIQRPTVTRRTSTGDESTVTRGSAPRPGAQSGTEHPHARPHAPHLPHPHVPHVPHPHMGKRAVDRVFKVEMAVVIVIALVFFGIWAEQQRATFTTNTDYVVCNWIEGC